jgi:hypothetical protein
MQKVVALVAALIAFSGFNQAPPYAFRLVLPRGNAVYLPYWFWKEVAVFEKFKECQEARQRLPEEIRMKWETAEIRREGEPAPRLVKIPPELLEKIPGVKRELQRAARAECVPIR